MKDGPDFSGSCHFLCTLFSLTFCLWPLWLPATPHAVSEKALHHIHVLCNPLTPCICSSFPLSFRLPLSLTSAIVISPSITSISEVLFSPTVFSSPHLISPLFTPSRSSLQACKNTSLLRPVLCASVYVCEWENESDTLYAPTVCLFAAVIYFR